MANICSNKFYITSDKPEIIEKVCEKLNKLFDSYKGKKVSRYSFTIRVGGVAGFFDCIKGFLHRIKKRISW